MFAKKFVWYLKSTTCHPIFVIDEVFREIQRRYQEVGGSVTSPTRSANIANLQSALHDKTLKKMILGYNETKTKKYIICTRTGVLLQCSAKTHSALRAF